MIGPSIVAVTISETVNIHIWAEHNLWVRSWTVLITLTGWLMMLLGLFRMFFPELQLEAAKHTSAVCVEIMFVLALGVFLTYKAYRRD